MNNKPIETFRSGTVKATVWANNGDDNQVFHTTTIARAYRDGNGEWRETNTYLAQHLADLRLVAGEAFRFIRMGVRTACRESSPAETPSDIESKTKQSEPAPEGGQNEFAKKETQRRGSGRAR